jgi:hypothetical protein
MLWEGNLTDFRHSPIQPLTDADGEAPKVTAQKMSLL